MFCFWAISPLTPDGAVCAPWFGSCWRYSRPALSALFFTSFSVSPCCTPAQGAVLEQKQCSPTVPPAARALRTRALRVRTRSSPAGRTARVAERSWLSRSRRGDRQSSGVKFASAAPPEPAPSPATAPHAAGRALQSAPTIPTPLTAASRDQHFEPLSAFSHPQ